MQAASASGSGTPEAVGAPRYPRQDYLALSPNYPACDPDILSALGIGNTAVLGFTRCIVGKDDCDALDIGHGHVDSTQTPSTPDTATSTLDSPLIKGELKEKILSQSHIGRADPMDLNHSVDLCILWLEARLEYQRLDMPMHWECPHAPGLAQSLHALAINYWLYIGHAFSKKYTEALDRFPTTERIEELDRAISLLEEAVEVASKGKEGQEIEKSKYLVHLGMLLRSRNKLHPIVNAIDRTNSIAMMLEAVQLLDSIDAGALGPVSELDPVSASRQRRALSMISVMCQESLDVGDPNGQKTIGYVLDAAWRSWRLVQANFGAPRPSDDWIHGIRYASALAFAASRVQPDQKVFYLNRAIEQAWYVHKFLKPFWGYGREFVVLQLVEFLQEKGRCQGTSEELEEGMQLLREALEKNRLEQPACINRHWDLRRARLQGALSNIYAAKYYRDGRIEDLEEGISLLEEVVNVMENPLFGEAQEFFGYLSILAILLQNRYMKLQAVEDLHRAVQLYERSCKKTGQKPQNSRLFDAVQNLYHLAVMYMTRFSRTQLREDFDKAFTHAEEAMNAAQLGDSMSLEDKAIYYDFYAEVLSIRSFMDKNGYDIHNSILAAERAVLLTAPDAEERPSRLHRLASCLLEQGLHLNDVDGEKTIQRCVDLGREALELCPPTSLYYARLSISLARAHMYCTLYLSKQDTTLGTQSAKMQQIGESVVYYLAKGFNAESSPYRSRLRALLSIVGSFLDRETRLWYSVADESIYGLLCKAVDMLPMDSSRDLKLDDHEQKMRSHSWVAPLTAALGISLGKPAVEALARLELGRGVIQSQWIDYRSDISPLRNSHPVLAERFHDLRVKLDHEFITIHGDIYRNSKTLSICMKEQNILGNRRLRAARQMDDTLAEIRACPGFERFLLSPEEAEFRMAARKGPIIIVNVNQHLNFASAIIVQTTGVTSLVLNDVTHDEAVEKMTIVNGGIRGDYFDVDFEEEFEVLLAENNRSMLRNIAALDLEDAEGKIEDYNLKMRGLYGWLWDKVVQPILGELGYLTSTPPSVGTLPHVWWIGVGALAGAPFHAAGYYPRLERNAKYAAKYCISSYTSTIKALLYSREKAARAPSAHSIGGALRMMVVSMPTTPGHSDLGGVTAELNEIASSAEGVADVVLLESPSAETTLKNISEGSYSIMHFACHGVADAAEPSCSRLLLQKPNSSGGTPELDELTVKAIASVRPAEDSAGSTLAYLSACSSADQQLQRDLREEGLHIASAFQLAGFSHVIGTLWESEDDVCAEVAGEFYKLLLQPDVAEEGSEVGLASPTAKAAEALHYAVDKVRRSKKYWARPWAWAPFTHWGA
ncbi:CHAT domain-containing protein [Peziza echinospora]|nr:CHAT domain-containing protein [Peziza echinospora]